MFWIFQFDEWIKILTFRVKHFTWGSMVYFNFYYGNFGRSNLGRSISVNEKNDTPCNHEDAVINDALDDREMYCPDCNRIFYDRII